MPNTSFVQGLADVPLRFQTIGAVLDEAAAQYGPCEALVVRHQDVRWTYAELKEHVDSFAAALLMLGLSPGDRIGIWAPNCCEWVVTQFACAKAGLILVNLNPAYRAAELEVALNRTGCRVLIMAEGFRGASFMDILRGLAPELSEGQPTSLRVSRLPRLRCVVRLGMATAPGSLSFSELLKSGAPREPLQALSAQVQPDDPCSILFTSGTTGLPKGATLTHFNIVNNANFVARALRLGYRDRMCIPVPLYHCFGMVMGNMGCVTHGATMVYPGEWFDPGQTLATIAAERCTVLYGVPTMFIAELEHAEFSHHDLTSLRTGIMGGAPCPLEVMERVIRDMHLKEITIAYGMTETSPVSFQSSVEDSLERRVSTVGRVHPHLQVKIIDGAGRVVPRGQQGELLTRGYSVMQGYWQDPEHTREVIDAAGWMHTGDLAVLDTQGYCRITGRLKDMLIRGGENIFPRDIEEFLYRHPKVQAVHAFGVPDQKFGEELCVCVQLKPGLTATDEEIKHFCRGQLARHNVPRYVRFVEEFPLTVSGKAQKFVMREHMCRELGIMNEPRHPGK
jgi:fatty-acyl-CoA synthase